MTPLNPSPVASSLASEPSDDSIPEAGELSVDDIERAYQKALDAMEDGDWSEPESNRPNNDPTIGAVIDDSSVAGDESTDMPHGEQSSPTPLALAPTDSSTVEPSTTTQITERADQSLEARDSAANSKTSRAGAPPRLRIARPTPGADSHTPEPEATPRVTPQQVIEAALFVGGEPLSVKKILGLLRGSFDRDFVEQTIDELNVLYTDEARPYEIRHVDGGYRMQLRPEFERLRNRVYGIGPREVKLSQETLEVLAVVAYRQPITRDEIEVLHRRSAGSILRQLLQRELIGLTRGDVDPKQVTYHTTDRFLSVFGITELADLPQADDVETK